jgi:dynein heavy chain
MNAEISSSIADTNTLLSTLISMQADTGGGGGESTNKDEQVMQTCTALLEKLPENIDLEDVRDRNEADQSPLKVVLLQEIERYNVLLSKTRVSIKQLQKGIQGLIVISKDQEEVMAALFQGLVPASWLVAYPSMKPLSSWMPDLLDRIAQLISWGFEGVPKVMWLGGLTYPTSMLTALLQASARRNQVSVDTYSFDFVVQTGDESSIQSVPKEGAYIKNMILEGAKWDNNAQALADADTMQLYAPMPIVHFKPVVRKKAVTEGIYACPLYLYPVRTGTRERPSFMYWVELKAGQFTPDQWTKRGTALLLAVA